MTPFEQKRLPCLPGCTPEELEMVYDMALHMLNEITEASEAVVIRIARTISDPKIKGLVVSLVINTVNGMPGRELEGDEDDTLQPTKGNDTHAVN